MLNRVRIAVSAVVAAAIVPVSGCTACSAVGYVYSGPAVIEFAAPLGSDLSLSACFGEECEPSTVSRDDGRRWEVPQESPFVEDMIPVGPIHGDGSERLLRVVVTHKSGTTLGDAVHEIPVTVEPAGVFGQCPGPFAFEPLVLPLPS